MYLDVHVYMAAWRQTIYLCTVVDGGCCFRISDRLKFELVLHCYMHVHVCTCIYVCTCIHMYICMYMYNVHHVLFYNLFYICVHVGLHCV